jgi:hypothetical protein
VNGILHLGILNSPFTCVTNADHSLVDLSRMFLHFGRNYDRFDRDRMVVIFTTAYVIGAYHH